MSSTEGGTVDELDKASFSSPLGRLSIYADGNGITNIKYGGSDKNSDETLQQQTQNPHLQTCLTWLEQYFEDPSKLNQIGKPGLSLKPYRSKRFLVKVWQVLQASSQVGEVITYGRLAALAGNSKAGQSVGQAMRRNPFPILVPCHRVIRANAKIGNYSWLEGVATKKWLLDHERKFVKNKTSTTEVL
eukprot:gene5379-6054_t